MKNSMRIKMFKLEKIANILDELNSTMEYISKNKRETLEKPEDERAYWENEQLPVMDLKLEAYTELYKALEKMF